METQLTDHFTFEELTRSDTAERLGIPNTLPVEVAENLTTLAENLEKVRAILGRPMRISSGFRSQELNAKIGGAQNSAHVQGLAADFTCPQFGTPVAICRALLRHADLLKWDQLIQEGSWVHIAFAKDPDTARGDVLTANFSGGRTTYTRGVIG